MIGRKHRRLVVTSGAAGLLVTGWLLSRPSIDPRLVGTWTIHYRADTGISWPIPRVELRPDGTATWWASSIPQNREYRPTPWRWSVRGSRLVWHSENETLSEAVRRQYDWACARLSNHSVAVPSETTFEVVAVSDNEVAVDIAANKQLTRWLFRRAE